MLTKTTHRRRAVALCGAVLILATGCAQSHGHSPQQLSEMIADTVRDSAASGPLGLGVPDTLFDPARYSCSPAVDPALPGGWRSEAPRETVEDEKTVELGLSDSEGDHSGPVAATVTDPSGEIATAEAEPDDSGWARLVYPDAFDGAEELATGVHTVVWSDAGTGAPITCDGFEVE
ncbi:hypothetical protein [Nocardiopsis sp. B62]|uniref:hypothetical protein n=1 Tax=Nocardiopsis sp. B62 TaxID=2824874 RepID=UPI001B37E66A|nr:hypothetical protein [Nocardiopsis sp. B62]MBQ1084622.1 hypothetical protein [Nocardiopsis sp. B62]